MKEFRESLKAHKENLDNSKKHLIAATVKAYKLRDTLLSCAEDDYSPYDEKFVENIRAASEFYPYIEMIYNVNVVGTWLAEELTLESDEVADWGTINRALDLHPNFLGSLQYAANNGPKKISEKAEVLLNRITKGEIAADTKLNEISGSNKTIVFLNLGANFEQIDFLATSEMQRIKTQRDLLLTDKAAKALQVFNEYGFDFDFKQLYRLYQNNVNYFNLTLSENVRWAVKAGMNPNDVTKYLDNGHFVSKTKHLYYFDYLTSDTAVEYYKSGVSFEALKDNLYRRIGTIKSGNLEFPNVEKVERFEEDELEESSEKTIALTKDLEIFKKDPEVLRIYTNLRMSFGEHISQEDDNEKETYKAVCEFIEFDHKSLRTFFTKQVIPMLNNVIKATHIEPASEILKDIKDLYENDLLDKWFKFCKERNCLGDFKGLLKSLSNGKVTDNSLKEAFGFGIDNFDKITPDVRKRLFGFNAMCLYFSGAKFNDLVSFFIKDGKITDGRKEKEDFDKFANDNFVKLCILSRRFQALKNIYKRMRPTFDMLCSGSGFDLLVTELNNKESLAKTELLLGMFGLSITMDNQISFAEGIDDQRALDDFAKKASPFLKVSGSKASDLHNMFKDNKPAFEFYTSTAIVKYLESGSTIQDLDDITNETGNYTAATQQIIKLNSGAQKAKIAEDKVKPEQVDANKNEKNKKDKIKQTTEQNSSPPKNIKHQQRLNKRRQGNDTYAQK